MEAEYMAANQATREAIWLQGLLNELGRSPRTNSTTIPINIDSQSCISLARNPEHHARSKHIDIQHHFI
jgi:hypothetical protein